MRLAVLWTEVPGYLSACLKRLVQDYSVELLVVSDLANRPQASRRAFDDELFSWMPQFHRIRHQSYRIRLKQIREILWAFRPSALLVAFQWRYLETYPLIREAKRNGIVTIGTMDDPWLGSAKQRAMAFFVRQAKLLPLDAIWVPGERAAQYAVRLFGSRLPIWRGMYCADTELYGASFSARQDGEVERSKTLLFVGRLAPGKGTSDLLEAYSRYRCLAAEPWELVCVGDGPLRSTIEERPGLCVLGFKQPAEVAAIMRQAGAFVLPSRREPWGVVIHEAALSRLPIVCSDSCGASVELVQDGFNGLLYRAGDIDELVRCLCDITSGQHDLRQMGENSAALARRYSVQLWARTLMDGLHRLQTQAPRAKPED